MLDLKNFQAAISQIAEEKGIDKEKVAETIEQALAAAYKKEYGSKNEIVRAKMDSSTGEVKFWKVRIVVDDSVLKKDDEEEVEPYQRNDEVISGEAMTVEGRKVRFNEERHIMLDEALEIKPEAMVGEEIIFPLEEKEDFGRIAAQTAKQVILQRLREAEREAVISDFANKEGEIVSGVIQRFERKNVYVNLGRAQGTMFLEESIPGERYNVGTRMKFYILAIQEGARGPMIMLSRRHPDFIEKLFELEVPEIANETIKIVSIAREAGARSKVAVHSNVEGIDPIGSCVGQKGTRVMAVLNEIGGEKIDIVKWSEDTEEFVVNALSPAKVVRTEIGEEGEVQVFVPEDQISLAIGSRGQNVRLAAKLTDRRIDVRNEEKPEDLIDGGTALPEEDDLEEGEELNDE